MKYTLLFCMAAMAACGNSTNPVTTKNNAGTPETAATAVSDDRKGTTITVTLTGGANAGTYTATSAESTCSMGLTGDKSFGNQYSETGKTNKQLSSLQLIVDDYDEAKKGTANFNIMIGFGDLLNGNSYRIDSAKNQGEGKITITESGSAKIATIEGKTKDGVAIKAVITCKTTQRMVDGYLKEE